MEKKQFVSASTKSILVDPDDPEPNLLRPVIKISHSFTENDDD